MPKNKMELLQSLKGQKEKLKHQLGKLVVAVEKKENTLLKQEQILTKGGAPGELAKHFSDMPVYIMPGNAGDINKVIWPSFFTTDVIEVAPDQQLDTGFSVSKTAGFIMVSYAKAIYTVEDLGGNDRRYLYVDPDAPAGLGETPGLSFTWRNSSSTRDFTNTSVPLDHVGNPRWPSYLYAPQLVMPNENIGVSFINDNPTNTYRVALTFYGIRIRIEDSYDLLSTAFAGPTGFGGEQGGGSDIGGNYT